MVKGVFSVLDESPSSERERDTAQYLDLLKAWTSLYKSLSRSVEGGHLLRRGCAYKVFQGCLGNLRRKYSDSARMLGTEDIQGWLIPGSTPGVGGVFPG